MSFVFPSYLLYGFLCLTFKQLYLHIYWKLDTCLYEIIYSEWSILPPPKIFNIHPEKSCIFWVCVCRLSYPACNADPSRCHVCPLWLAVFFFSHKRRDFRKRNLLNMKRMSRFPVHILSEIFLILRRIERDLLIM